MKGVLGCEVFLLDLEFLGFRLILNGIAIDADDSKGLWDPVC